jgi:predicted Zn-dependent peptidase
MFEVSAKLASGAKVADVQKAIDAQIADLAKNGPTDDELKKVKTRLNASFLLGLESNIARAQKVAEFEVYRGDAKLFEEEPQKFGAVTREDVKRAVAKYLTANRRNTIEVKPAASEKK